MTIWFDLTTLANNLPPADGIAKVELSIARTALSSGAEVRFCYFYQVQKNYVALVPEAFEIIDRRYRTNQRASDFHFPIQLDEDSPCGVIRDHDALIVLGMPFRGEHFEFLQTLKQRAPIRLMSVVHDLIPWRYPAWYPRLFAPLLRYFAWQAHHCDHLFCISHSSQNDFLAWCQETLITPPPTSIITLGVDKIHPQPLPIENALEGVLPQQRQAFQKILTLPFFLQVSTVNIRKGHDTIARALLQLIAEQPHINLPQWVMVGDLSLMADEWAIWQNDPRLANRWIHFHQLGDSALDWLYRHCLFTVYPSRFEGWGMPIAESLCYGKPCLCANNSSLPEVAGSFAECLPSENINVWALAIRTYSHQPVARAVRTQYLQAFYQPPLWHDTMRAILRVAQGMEA